MEFPEWIVFFANSKILHDSTGSVKSTTKKGPENGYFAPSLPSLCFHLNNLLFI